MIDSFESEISGYNINRSLELLAYDGPQFGIKYLGDGGYKYFFNAAATVVTLKEYADAGFNAWYCFDATWGNNFRYVASGNTEKAKGSVTSGTWNDNYACRDVFWALDLAAEYAHTYGKPMPVYVVIDDVISLNTANLDLIGTAYDVLTSYCDKYNGANSSLGKTSQLAGFILKDEPTLPEYDAFAAVFNYLAYTKGAIAAGYSFEVALLQEYAPATAEYLGTAGYRAYLDKYAPLFKDTAISYDNYPFSYNSYTGVYSMGLDYFQNMEKVRAKEAAVYGTCIQSYVAGEAPYAQSHKAITMESEISLQVFGSLAYGFTRLNYFDYWQRNSDATRVSDSQENFQNNMIRWNDYSDWTKGYTTTELYTWAKNTNEKALKLSAVLMRFNSTGVQPIYSSELGAGERGKYFNTCTQTNTANPITITSTYDLLVGGFQNEKYNGYLAVATSAPHDNRPETRATFDFGSGYNFAIVYTTDGEKNVCELFDGKLSLSIAAGDAAFIVPIA